MGNNELDRRRLMTIAAATAGGALGGTLFAPSILRGAEMEKITLGAIPFTSSGHVFLAMEKGWFRDAGVDVTLRRFNTAGQLPVAVVSGDLDMGTTGLTASFYNIAGKGDIRMIAGLPLESTKPSETVPPSAATSQVVSAWVSMSIKGLRVAISLYTNKYIEEPQAGPGLSRK